MVYSAAIRVHILGPDMRNPSFLCIFAIRIQFTFLCMADNDFSQQLHDIKGITDVRALAKEVPCSLLLPYLSDEDIRVARNAAWVLTHKPISQILALPHDQLINLAMTTPDTPLRRLTLCLVEKQPILKEEINTGFLDFCLLHMHMPDEPPGVQALCMKLAYSMCSPYPELLHEFQETLNLMQPEQHKPGVKHLINKIKEKSQKGR